MAKTDEKLDIIEEKLGRVIDIVSSNQNDLQDLKTQVTSIEEALRGVLISIDKLAKSQEDMLMEYVAVKQQLARHEIWFQQIATKVGLQLTNS